MIGALFALLLAAAAPADRFVGVYDGGQIEVAAGLELAADGRFRYALSYGALDEMAAGRWSLESDRIRLRADRFETNDPRGGSFDDPGLAIDGSVLLLTRHGLLLRFRPERR